MTTNAAFRVYNNVAQSIADHSQLLATDPSYQQAMADRHLPDAFATDLTGVYATDPQYGSNLIAIMRLYNLYRYDTAHAGPRAAAGGSSRRRPIRARRPTWAATAARPGRSIRAERSARARRRQAQHGPRWDRQPGRGDDSRRA